ncbi:MAG: double zinc ribbon domain-containing protein [Candidatus Limnocylindria bacterium]
MELIRDIIEWLSAGWGDRLGLIFPILLVGVLALYVVWLLLGYLRVSQIGLHDGHGAAEGTFELARSAEGLVEAPRGVPYCAVDGIQYPASARFCTVCERDLSRDCVNCGATLRAAEASCYRCGVRTGAADALLS